MNENNKFENIKKKYDKCIAVDLTPVLPGGENGGAKHMTLRLVEHLSQIAKDFNFILLTSDENNNELAFLDSDNISRLIVFQKNPVSQKNNVLNVCVDGLRKISKKFFPEKIVNKIKSLRLLLLCTPRPKSLLKKLNVDLLFCPFTAPSFHDPTVPVVSIVYDLQHVYYPQFFSSEERASREMYLNEVCRVADRIVCISDYVRDTFLENFKIDPERVKTIYIRLAHRLKYSSYKNRTDVLKSHNLTANNYFLYPANFWFHKNHRMLLISISIYRKQNPESNFCFVCNGVPCKEKDNLEKAAEQMGIGKWIRFPEFMSNEEFSVLLQSCRAMIFPSLFEGFGMPVLEAMAFGKPVLCSRITSLPEVAGDAAIYFDPRKPADIVKAIKYVENNQDSMSELVKKGYSRFSHFNDPIKMAKEYLEVFYHAFR